MTSPVRSKPVSVTSFDRSTLKAPRQELARAAGRVDALSRGPASQPLEGSVGGAGFQAPAAHRAADTFESLGAALTAAGVDAALGRRYGAGAAPAQAPDAFAPGEPVTGEAYGGLLGATSVDLMAFKSAAEAKQGLVSEGGAAAPAAGGKAPASGPTKTETSATDQQDGSGGQRVTQSNTTTDPDGTKHTDTQTHQSDGKGNSRETQDVERISPTGHRMGEHSEERRNADGSSSSFRSQWKSMPTPDSEVERLSAAEVQAELSNKRGGLVDPSSERSNAERDAGRLAQGTAVLVVSKVNPSPDASPREAAISGAPRGTRGGLGGDPVDENPRSTRPTPKPPRPEGAPIGTPGGGRKPRE